MHSGLNPSSQSPIPLTAPNFIEYEIGRRFRTQVQFPVTLGQLISTTYAILLIRLICYAAIMTLDHSDILL